MYVGLNGLSNEDFLQLTGDYTVRQLPVLRRAYKGVAFEYWRVRFRWRGAQGQRPWKSGRARDAIKVMARPAASICSAVRDTRWLRAPR